MIQFKKFIFTAIFITLHLVSCQSKQEKEGLAILNDELAEIQLIVEQYKTLPIDSLHRVLLTKFYPIANTIKNKPEIFEKLGADEQNILSEYSNYMKSVEDLIALGNKTIDGLIFARQQLTNLKNDIQHGLIPADSIKGYVSFEANNFAVIKLDVQKVLTLKTLPKDFKQIEQSADSIIEKKYGRIQNIVPQEN
ncbi:MAG TPA: hypothetical protein PK990_06530 [Salinivirgaceae bacterium]|nr:hypothetical protein [Salinivirgaceae bacterium]